MKHSFLYRLLFCFMLKFKRILKELSSMIYSYKRLNFSNSFRNKIHYLNSTQLNLM